MGKGSLATSRSGFPSVGGEGKVEGRRRGREGRGWWSFDAEEAARGGSGGSVARCAPASAVRVGVGVVARNNVADGTSE